MKKYISLFYLILFISCNCSTTDNLNCVVKHSEKQLEYALKSAQHLRTEILTSPRTFENDELKVVSAQDWTSGFFPGNLWMMYELTGDNKWKKHAIEYTEALEAEQWNGDDHDIGFKMYCSYGHAIKYTDDAKYREILIQSAKTLSTRYNPVVGCIRSWNSNPKTAHWKYPVIIDNMMNLELLMWAAKETGNNSFKEIAIKHAQTTMNNHFRDDYSCYHVIDYDPATGEVLNKNTHQGYADESDWSRGQGWAIYGFTMMYRETGMKEFLEQAKNVANYLLAIDGIKEGQIPYWDFEDPKIPNAPKDASAAAVIASALFELASYTKNDTYREVAKNILTSLSSPEYLAEVGENGGFLLKHSTGSLPYESEVDVPLVYADYYFLESIINYKKYE